WVRAHPFKTALSAAVGIGTIWLAAQGVIYLNVLLAPWRSNVPELAWVKRPPSFDPEPTDFLEKSDKARSIVESESINLEKVGPSRYVQTLLTAAAFYKKYGHWRDATNLLNRALPIIAKRDGRDSLNYVQVCKDE